MSDADPADEEGFSRVQRTRVTYIATRVHDRLRDIGTPEAFAERFVTLDPIDGLTVALPFGRTSPVDTRFWSALAEQSSLGDAVPINVARRLRRAGVPLRHQGSLEIAAVHKPRLEAHLHPFGVVSMATADILWDAPAPLSETSQRIGDLEDEPATVTVGQAELTSTLAAAAGDAADALVARLGGSDGSSWSIGDHRVSTVIEGTDSHATAMPSRNGPLHTALHQLARGGAVLADPGKAFIAHWSGADFGWAPSRLAYMLDAGMSFVASWSGDTKQVGLLGRRHREMTLLLAHVTSSVGLVRAAPNTLSPYFGEWAKHAAHRLARLYGPAAPRDWGLETRTFLASSGAVPEIEAILGTGLVAKYDVPPYP